MIFCGLCKTLIDATDESIAAGNSRKKLSKAEKLRDVEERHGKASLGVDAQGREVVVVRKWCPICSSNPANEVACAEYAAAHGGTMFVHRDGQHTGRSINFSEG